MIRRQIALINSMTKRERANPEILQASRKRRIAAGAGLEVSELNKLLKMQRQMADMMKKMGKGGNAEAGHEADVRQGRAPDMDDPAAMEAAARQLGGKMPPGMGGGMGGLPPGLGGGGDAAAPGPVGLRQEEMTRDPISDRRFAR